MFNRNCCGEREKTLRHDCLSNYFFLDVPEVRIGVALFGNSSAVLHFSNTELLKIRKLALSLASFLSLCQCVLYTVQD